MTADDVRAGFECRYSEDDVRACAKRMKFYDHQIAAAILTEYADKLAAHADLSGEVRDLVEAARYAMNNIHMVDGTAMDAVVGPTFTVYGMFLNKLHAALAKFRPTHQEKP